MIDTAINWGIDTEIETAIEIASTQTKSAFADSRNATRVGGFRLCRRGFNSPLYGLRLDRCNPTLDRIIEPIAHLTHPNLK
ncbi:hypothetical protein E5S67_00772 [Microcoleus sp. IPMA8]|uniref:Uncharacterized protein n=1 Tax=Microcoleus asticus IPMA8 TaxID=2563858 RepID=A0ABX2CRN9_9CYAN|nr:hypothetical protein [Microcoleus asticus IPMA8]